MSPAPQGTAELPAGQLRELAAELLSAAGVGTEQALVTAGLLVLADAWGESSHGLLRLPHYLRRLRAGGCNAAASLTPVGEYGGVLTLDGHAGLGHWQLWEAAGRAAQRAQRQGIAAVGVANSSHCGALGAYVYPLVEQGMVGLVFSTGPAVMPPWGGSEKLLSTSPLAAGIPSRPRPIVIDLATSAVARGKIAALAAAGRSLPAGWALAADGSPTTNAEQALHGMLAPLGGAKGYALALLVEALTAALVGPLPAASVPDMFRPEDDALPQGIGHLVIGIDPRRFRAGAESATAFDALAHSVTEAGGRIPSAARIAPRELQSTHPVVATRQVLGELGGWAERLGVWRPSWLVRATAAVA
jgi:(2R)-3-sulfolactate dehydrogenase (NADP+)